MMRVSMALIGVALLGGCMAPIPPVEVTRFHTSAVQASGEIIISAAPGLDVESLEFRTYSTAVATELGKAGYTLSSDATSPWIAEVGFARGTLSEKVSGSPVRVGVGGGTYGGGVGIGVGTSFPLGETDRTRDSVITKLSVRILARADGKPVWEGRAETSAPASAPAAQPGLAAAKLANALFTGFPGRSGETITVK